MKSQIHIIVSICIFMLIPLAPVFAFADDTLSTYTFDELYLQISVPSELIQITRDAVSDEQFLEEAGVDLPTLQKHLTDSYIYLNAMPKDLSYELALFMVSDKGTRDIWNLHDHDSSEIHKAVAPIESGYEQAGIHARFDSLYDTQPVVFFIVDVDRIEDGTRIYGRQYYTIVNGQGISVTCWAYTGRMTAEQTDMQRAVVDRLVFTQISENPAPSSSRGLFSGILINGLAWGFIGGVTSAVVSILNRSKMAKNSLEPCLVSDPSFAGATFIYKGKTYDREKYINQRMLRLNLMKNKEKVLPKILVRVNKNRDPLKPSAIINELEAEAITRILAD
ncbi:MAG: hypothetical protein FWH28_00120 [Clostridiales bacterium]|nr:hypothetical protein [Clostridiales bacterium]